MMILEVEEQTSTEVPMYEQILVPSWDLLSSPLRCAMRVCEEIVKDSGLSVVEEYRFEDRSHNCTVMGVVGRGLQKW